MRVVVLAVFIAIAIGQARCAFIAPSVSSRNTRNLHVSCAEPQASSDGFGDDAALSGSGDVDSPPIVATSVVKIDDGGSNLTDRFKYKVHALMGTYDPPPSVGPDDENQSGNILNAMLTFPVRYSFNVVGRTSGDDGVREEYVEAVKAVIASVSGDDDSMECRVTPRGKSFTRVSVQVLVESAAVINSIFDDLGGMDLTVMRY